MEKQLIVISGASKGIGRAIAELFAENGFDLAICSRNTAELSAAAKSISEKYQVKVHYFATDLSHKHGVIDFSQFVKTFNRPVGVLVNNTGRFLPGMIQNEADGVFESMINTNLASAYYLTRELLPDMISRRSGHIFNICSTASITAYTNGGSYCISKFALYGMSKVLREELKNTGIRVTSVLPGATRTDSWDGVDLPDNRFMKPADVAAAIWNAYQMSDRTVVEEILLRPQLGDL